MAIRARSAIFAAAIALLTSSAANAAVIVKNISFTASNFTGSGSAPASSVTLDFTISFDNSADINSTTTGFVVNTFTLPYSLAYAYDKTDDSLIVATNPSPAACTNPAGSFCTFIRTASTTPNATFVQLSPSDGGYLRASTIVMGAPSGAVPEPATWAMMIGGFGAIGAAARHRRRKATVSFA